MSAQNAEKELEEKLNDLLKEIRPLDEQVIRHSELHWDHIAKPLKSLGLLERNVTKLAGIAGQEKELLRKRALVIMCADNGVVAEGVTQTDSSVTAICAENMASASTTVTVMCDKAGVDVFPVDIGMITPGEVLCGIPEEKESLRPRTLYARKLRRGTRNFAKEPAMTREEALRGILVGIAIAGNLKKQGYEVIATGEMGIGNTTTSSAVGSVLLSQPAEVMTGKGAGLSDEGLQRKIRVISEAIRTLKPDAGDPVDVLSKVGGYDIAGMTGLFLGGAIYRIPVLIDGFISSVSALLAIGLEPAAKDFMLASHVSKEPAGHLILEALGLTPMLCCEMCLGEGTGAITALSVLDMAVYVYQNMNTFDDIEVEQYTPQ